MGTSSGIDRRRLLKTGLAAAAAGATGATGFARNALAATKVSHQLSWVKTVQYGGLFAGIDRGYFQKFGIEADLVSGGPNVDPVNNVASGRSQIGDRPISAILVAKQKGIPIKVIGTIFQKSPLGIISSAKNPIKTVKDLKGKTIAVPASSKALIVNMLKEAGMQASDANLVPASPDPSGIVSGQFDGYFGYITSQGVLLQLRGIDIEFLSANDGGFPETACTLYAREDYLAANKETVINYLKGAIQGYRWALDNPEATVKMAVEKYGSQGLESKQQSAEWKQSIAYIEFGPAKSHGLLSLDMKLFEQILSVYGRAGVVDRAMKVTDLCDPTYVNAAIASLKT